MITQKCPGKGGQMLPDIRFPWY